MKFTTNALSNIILQFPLWLTVLIGQNQPVSSGGSLSNSNRAWEIMWRCVCESLRVDVKQRNKDGGPYSLWTQSDRDTVWAHTLCASYKQVLLYCLGLFHLNLVENRTIKTFRDWADRGVRYGRKSSSGDTRDTGWHVTIEVTANITAHFFPPLMSAA